MPADHESRVARLETQASRLLVRAHLVDRVPAKRARVRLVPRLPRQHAAVEPLGHRPGEAVGVAQVVGEAASPLADRRPPSRACRGRPARPSARPRPGSSRPSRRWCFRRRSGRPPAGSRPKRAGRGPSSLRPTRRDSPAVAGPPRRCGRTTPWPCRSRSGESCGVAARSRASTAAEVHPTDLPAASRNSIRYQPTPGRPSDTPPDAAWPAASSRPSAMILPRSSRACQRTALPAIASGSRTRTSSPSR